MSFWLILLACLAAARVAVRLQPGSARELLFLAANLVAIDTLFFSAQPSHSIRLLVPVLYFSALAACYPLLTRFARARGAWWLSLAGPLLILVTLRYVPFQAMAAHGHWAWAGTVHFGTAFVGLSFLAFRLVRLAVDVRNGVVPVPEFLPYLGFCFFAPVMSVGPIHSYRDHRAAFDEQRERTHLSLCLLRVAVGAVKFRFLAPLLDQLAFTNLLLDGRLHRPFELLVGCNAYYLFLYLNFSGVCDMAIGVAAIIGVPLPENFANPFAARNVKDFWNRWHITLSTFMRDLVFNPASKALLARWGAARLNEALAVTILFVFALIGLWHGSELHFLLFGLLHGLAVVVVHYYTAALKRSLTREQWKAYHQSRLVRGCAIAVTFLYVALTMLVFANPISEIRWIFHALR